MVPKRKIIKYNLRTGSNQDPTQVLSRNVTQAEAKNEELD